MTTFQVNNCIIQVIIMIKRTDNSNFDDISMDICKEIKSKIHDNLFSNEEQSIFNTAYKESHQITINISGNFDPYKKLSHEKWSNLLMEFDSSKDWILKGTPLVLKEALKDIKCKMEIGIQALNLCDIHKIDL